jgi:putative ATP-binding cassette transporter
VILAIFASIVNGAASTLLIYWINRLITATPNNLEINFSVPSYIALLALVFASGVAAQVLLIRLTAKAVYELRLTLANRILALPLVKLESLGVSRLYATLTQDISAIANTLGALPILSFHVSIIIGGLSYLGWLSWQWLLWVLLVIVVAVLVYELLARKARRLIAEHRQEQDALYEHFNALLNGTKELKLRAQRQNHFIQNALDPTATRLKDKYQSAYSAWALGANWANLLAFFMVGTLALFYYHHAAGLSLSVLTAYVLTLMFMRAHFGGALNMLPALAQGNIALKKIEALELTESQKPSNNVSHEAPKPDWQYLELTDVCFNYPATENGQGFTFGPLNAHFKPGEIVFITGGNGSGKSTFAKLITGLYQPTSGSICIDGSAVNTNTIAWYQQHFSVVFADYFLFDEMLPNKPKLLKQEVEHYLSLLELTHKVSLQDNRLSTTALSSGQRKRLALLNAYLEDSEIYLFDEWAADQDPHFKRIFYQQLLPKLKSRGKTVLVISHDDRYFNIADRVLKFEDGQLIMRNGR